MSTVVTRRKKRNKHTGRTFLLMILMAGLGTVGFRNYQRNVAAEANTPRPYRTYDVAQLEQLEVAYQVELDGLVARYSNVSGNPINAQDKGLIGERIKEFERVQRLSNSVRSLGYEISEREAALNEVSSELRSRADMAPGVKLFLRRVFTFST